MLCLLILQLGTLRSANLYRVACGASTVAADSSGNLWAPDSAMTPGGSVWGSVIAESVPYNHLRYSNPALSPLTYNFPAPTGNYIVTLKFIEPSRTIAGSRVFSVTINGTVEALNLDLFAQAGKAKPYDVVSTVASTGTISIVLQSSVSNSVISAIQIDDIPPPPPTFIPGPGITILTPPPGGGPSIISTDSAFIPIYGLGPIATRPTACQAGQIWMATDTPPFVTFCNTPGNPGIWSGGMPAAQVLQCQGNGTDPTTGAAWNCAGLLQVSILGSDSTLHQIVGAAWQMTPAPPYAWIPVIW